MAKIERKYGYVPDLPDFRDHVYSIQRRITKLPQKVDLRPICPPIENQQHLGSCSAFALTSTIEILEKKNKRPCVEQFSPLFLYYNERVAGGLVMVDSGSSIRNGIKSLAREGCCREGRWPYDTSKYKKKPTARCYEEALECQILEYKRINTVDEMKACLADGFPFVFGFTVYESFDNTTTRTKGIANMPTKDERVLGGHAVVGVGYDDSTNRFLIRNSYGETWGMRGCFTIPYAYLADRNLSDDFWMITKGEKM